MSEKPRGGIDRRRFLEFSALAAGALSTRPLAALALSPKDFRPLERRGAPTKILVVGGGLAGLSAAWRLIEAGHEVTVLEAQRRAGGRVLTLREPFSDGLYAEAGAGRIPDTHTLTLHYVGLFGLELDPFYPSSGLQVLAVGGRRFPYRNPSDIDLATVPLELTPEERRLGLKGMDATYVAAGIERLGDFEAPGWPPASLAELDRLTFAEYLRGRGASEAAIAFLSAGFEEDGALDYLRDARSHYVGMLSKIRGGNDRLPRAFAAKLDRRIHYGSPVVAIRQDSAAVEAVVSLAGGQTRVFHAERLVCAVPVPVLRTIRVEPDFSKDKRAAIEKLSCGSVTRILLQSRRRFWEDTGGNGFATIDQPMEIWSPSFDQPGRRGLLAAYTYERLARRLARLSEAERVRWAVETLGTVHPGLDEECEGGVSKCWDEDPWARGAFPVFGPGQIGSLTPALTRPEGRVHFAGDAVSPYPGWMQGALMAGHRAAEEVNRRRP